MTQKRLLWMGRWLLALMIFLYLMQRLDSLGTEISGEAIAFASPFWLLASLMSLFIYYSGLGIPWFFLYRGGGVTSVSFRTGWAFFQFSQLGRYMPGKVGQFVWMLSFSRRFGIEKTWAVLATCLQLAFQCGLGGLIGIPVLQRTEFLHLDNLLASFHKPKTGLLIASIAIVTLGVGIAFRERQGLRKILSRLRKQTRAIFSVSGVLSLISAYILLWGIFGSAFFLFIKGFYPIATSQLFAVIGISAAAWCIGFLSFLTPSGLGVREGVLMLLLTRIGFPPVTATLIALLSRLWTLSAELLIGGAAFGLYLRQKHLSHN